MIWLIQRHAYHPLLKYEGQKALCMIILVICIIGIKHINCIYMYIAKADAQDS